MCVVPCCALGKLSSGRKRPSLAKAPAPCSRRAPASFVSISKCYYLTTFSNSISTAMLSFSSSISTPHTHAQRRTWTSSFRASATSPPATSSGESSAGLGGGGGRAAGRGRECNDRVAVGRAVAVAVRSGPCTGPSRSHHRPAHRSPPSHPALADALPCSDWKTGDSLNYGFIGFDTEEACEQVGRWVGG